MGSSRRSRTSWRSARTCCRGADDEADAPNDDSFLIGLNCNRLFRLFDTTHFPANLAGKRSNQLHPQLAADDFGRPLQTLDRRVAVVGVEKTIKLCPARFHQLSHAFLRELLFLHFGSQLSGDNRFDGRDRDLLADSRLIEPTFERRADMTVLLLHHDISLSRRRAIAKSSGAVFRVFLMKACKAISMPL